MSVSPTSREKNLPRFAPECSRLAAFTKGPYTAVATVVAVASFGHSCRSCLGPIATASSITVAWQLHPSSVVGLHQHLLADHPCQFLQGRVLALVTVPVEQELGLLAPSSLLQQEPQSLLVEGVAQPQQAHFGQLLQELLQREVARQLVTAQRRRHLRLRLVTVARVSRSSYVI